MFDWVMVEVGQKFWAGLLLDKVHGILQRWDILSRILTQRFSVEQTRCWQGWAVDVGSQANVKKLGEEARILHRMDGFRIRFLEMEVKLGWYEPTLYFTFRGFVIETQQERPLIWGAGSACSSSSWASSLDLLYFRSTKTRSNVWELHNGSIPYASDFCDTKRHKQRIQAGRLVRRGAQTACASLIISAARITNEGEVQRIRWRRQLLQWSVRCFFFITWCLSTVLSQVL